MKIDNTTSNTDQQEALKDAFEKGYVLGLNDGKEGVFIDVARVVEHFYQSTLIDHSMASVNLTSD